ncbi:MAG: glycosyltransferase family 2 protein [Acidimicrobiales bacterium]
MPRVTVVTATYNWATVLPFCIASVRAQTFGDFEHLVIGDGCTDESAEVVMAAADGDPRIRWVNLASNTGHQWGPNSEGIRLADSDFIAYLGHDDLWVANHLENLVPALDAPGVGLVHSSTVLVHPSSGPARWPEPGWSYEPPTWIPPSSVVHRRDVAVEAGGWTAPDPDSPSDPEAVLWAAIAARRSIRWVPRLTCVKLPAAQRRGVYRDRPCHEQAYWLDRIGAADDPEQELARAIDEPYSLAVAPQRRAFDGERLRWAVRTRARRLVGRAPVTGEERTRLRRRFKGLD